MKLDGPDPGPGLFLFPVTAFRVGSGQALGARLCIGLSHAKEPMIRTGFYSGSFDPVTLGHTDVIYRAAGLLDRLVIGIGINPGKAPMFETAERVLMLEEEVRPIAKATKTEISVVTFSGLAVDAARSNNASVIIRGLRDGTDFDYEMQMAGMNGAMAPDIQTVYVAASPAVRHIAANLVRAIVSMGGDPSPFVSAGVLKRLRAKSGQMK
jgi:pantetheine-phosphate adenylyltransferase